MGEWIVSGDWETYLHLRKKDMVSRMDVDVGFVAQLHGQLGGTELGGQI